MVEFVLSFLLSYFVQMLGISIGYHRLLSHRSYKCPKFVEYFWVMAGYLAFQTSPIWWATMHRAHHRYSDTQKDAHARLHGWRRCVYGWIFDEKYPDHVDPYVTAKDLVSDPIYQFLDQGGNVQRAHLLNGFLCFLFRFLVILPIFGLPAALGSLAAGLLMQQVTLLFNLVSHIPSWGYRNYSTVDDSVNIPWLAYITMGEGWHNNHHSYPGAARSGLTSKEFDFGWIMISLMKRLKLVSWANDGQLAKEKLEEHLENTINVEDMTLMPIASVYKEKEPNLAREVVLKN